MGGLFCGYDAFVPWEADERSTTPGRSPASVVFHQNNILSKAPNGAPGDVFILLSAEQPKEAAAAGDDQGSYLPSVHIYFLISYLTKSAAILNADDFLIAQFCDTSFHPHSSRILC